jgi:hypothetical protein
VLTITKKATSLPRQTWKRPWGVLEAWTCETGYRVVRAQVKTTPQVLLVGFGDLHFGSPHFDLALATEVRDWIRKRGALWVGMGDILECATRASVGAGVYEQIKTPDEQIEEIVPFLEPIADQCLGLVKGNHEERGYKLAGIDPMGIVARELDVPYCGWEIWGVISRIPVPARAWTFYGVHSGAGNKSGGLALGWTDREIRKYASVDIILRAHTHSKGFDPVSTLQLNTTGANPAVMDEERYLVTTGHFLRRAGSYAAGKALPPKPSGSVALRLPVNRNALRSVQPIYLPEGEEE